MTFRTLLESLKIIKKGDKSPDSKELGTIGSFKIHNTKHVTDKRNGVKRNDGLDIRTIKKVLTDFLKHIPKPKNSKYDIIYKDPKFNKLVIMVKNHDITIITIIQSQRNKNTYLVQDNQIQIDLNKLSEDTNMIVSIFQSILCG